MLADSTKRARNAPGDERRLGLAQGTLRYFPHGRPGPNDTPRPCSSRDSEQFASGARLAPAWGWGGQPEEPSHADAPFVVEESR